MAGIVQSHCANDPEPGRRVLSDDQWRSIERQLALSRREVQLVQHVFDDCTEQVMAEELGVSVHTVHSQMDRLYDKLRLHSRVGLVVRAVAMCLAPPNG